MLRTIGLTLAIAFFALITLLFLDFTGTLHAWLGWMAQIQFLPAVLALNVGVVAALALLTLLCGRVYRSVICPLGVFQDIVSWLRYGVLGVFIVALVAGVHSLVALLAPYSSYGRIASSFFAPVCQWANNLLACLAERADSYAFYGTEVWLKSLPTLAVAGAILMVPSDAKDEKSVKIPVVNTERCIGYDRSVPKLRQASHCIGCNQCSPHCPQSIDIPKELHRIDEYVEKLKQNTL